MGRKKVVYEEEKGIQGIKEIVWRKKEKLRKKAHLSKTFNLLFIELKLRIFVILNESSEAEWSEESRNKLQLKHLDSSLSSEWQENVFCITSVIELFFKYK